MAEISDEILNDLMTESNTVVSDAAGRSADITLANTQYSAENRDSMPTDLGKSLVGGIGTMASGLEYLVGQQVRGTGYMMDLLDKEKGFTSKLGEGIIDNATDLYKATEENLLENQINPYTSKPERSGVSYAGEFVAPIPGSMLVKGATKLSMSVAKTALNRTLLNTERSMIEKAVPYLGETKPLAPSVLEGTERGALELTGPTKYINPEYAEGAKALDNVRTKLTGGVTKEALLAEEFAGEAPTFMQKAGSWLGRNAKEQSFWAPAFTHPLKDSPEGKYESPTDYLKRLGVNVGVGLVFTHALKGAGELTGSGYRKIRGIEKPDEPLDLNKYKKLVDDTGGFLADKNELNLFLKESGHNLEDSASHLDMKLLDPHLKDGKYDLKSIAKDENIDDGLYLDSNGEGVVKIKDVGTFEIKGENGSLHINAAGSPLTRKALISTTGDSVDNFVFKPKSKVYDVMNRIVGNSKAYTSEPLQAVDENGEVLSPYKDTSFGDSAADAAKVDAANINKIKADLYKNVPQEESVLSVPKNSVFKSVRSLAHNIVIKGITENVPEVFKRLNTRINKISKHLQTKYAPTTQSFSEQDVREILQIQATSNDVKQAANQSLNEKILDDVAKLLFDVVESKGGSKQYFPKKDLYELIERSKAIAVYQKHIELSRTKAITPGEFKARDGDPMFEPEGDELGSFYIKPEKLAGIMKDMLGVKTDNKVANEYLDAILKNIANKHMQDNPLKAIVGHTNVKASDAMPEGSVKLTSIVDEANIKDINPVTMDMIDKADTHWNQYTENKDTLESAYSGTVNINDKVPKEFANSEQIVATANKNNGIVSDITINTAIPTSGNEVLKNASIFDMAKRMSNTLSQKNKTDSGKSFAKYLWGYGTDGKSNGLLGKMKDLLNSPKIDTVEADMLVKEIAPLLGKNYKEFYLSQKGAKEVMNDIINEIEYHKKLYEDDNIEFLAHDVEITDTTRPMYVGLYNPQNSAIHMQLFTPAGLRDGKVSSTTSLTYGDLKNDVGLKEDIVAINRSTIDMNSKDLNKKIMSATNDKINEVGGVKNITESDFDSIVDGVFREIAMSGKTDKLKSYIGLHGYTKLYLMDTVDGFADKFGDKATIQVFGTVDAKTSNFNNKLAMIGVLDESTGLGSFDLGQDIRNKLVDDVTSMFPGIQTEGIIDKEIVKPLFTGWFYGGQMSNLTGEEASFLEIISSKIIDTYSSKSDNFFRTVIGSNIKSSIDRYNEFVINTQKSGFTLDEITGLSNLNTVARDKLVSDDIIGNILKQREVIAEKKLELNRKLASKDSGIDVSSIKRNIAAHEEIINEIDAHLDSLKFLNELDMKLKSPKREQTLEDALTDRDKLYLFSQLKDSLYKQIGTTLERTMSGDKYIDLINMRKMLEGSNMAHQIAFYESINRNVFDSSVAITGKGGLLESIIKDSSATLNGTKINGGKTISLDKAAQAQIERNLRARGMFGIGDVIEEIAKTGNLNESIMHWKPLANAVPKIRNANNEYVPLVKLGSHSYNIQSDLKSFDLSGPSIFSLYDPIYVISHDVNIMERSFTEGQVYRYDAVYGGTDVLATAVNSNKAVGDMLVNYNPMASIEESLYKYKTIFKDSHVSDKTFNEIAKQHILNNGGIISKEEIDKIVMRYKDFAGNESSKYDFVKMLKEVSERTVGRKNSIRKRLKDGESIDVNNFQMEHGLVKGKTNYALGNNDVRADASLLPNKNVNRENFIGSRIDKSLVDGVEVPKDVDSSNVLYGRGVSPSDGISTSIDVQLEPEIFDPITGEKILGLTEARGIAYDYGTNLSTVQVNGTDFIVKLSSQLDDISRMKVTAHEVSHIAEDMMKANRKARLSPDTSMDTLDAIKRRIFVSMGAKYDPEGFTDSLGSLMMNEIVLENAGIFKGILKGLKSENPIKPSELLTEIKVTDSKGNIRAVGTMDELIGVFDKGSTERYVLENYRKNFVSAINQQGIKDIIFGNKNRSEIFLWNDLKDNSLAKKVNQLEDVAGLEKSFFKIQTEADLFNWFRQDRTRVAAEVVAGKSKDFQNEVETMMKSAKTEIRKFIDDTKLDGNIRDKEVFITNTVKNGYQYVSKLLLNKGVKDYAEAKNLAEGARRTMLKEIAEYVYATGTKEVASIKQKLDNFAEGSYGSGSLSLSEISRDLKRNNNNIFIEDLNKKVEQYVAYQRFLKNSNADEFAVASLGDNMLKLKKVYTALDGSYMSNDDILFGINPRSYLNMYNQSIYLVDEVRPGENVIGNFKVYSNDGTPIEKIAITRDRESVMAGKRDSNVLDPTLSAVQEGKLANMQITGKIYSNGKELNLGYDAIHMNYLHLNDQQDFFSMKVSDILFNNYYTNQKKLIAGKIMDDQFNVMRKSGLIVSEDAMKSMPSHIQSKFTDAPIKNAEIQKRYGNWYVNKRFQNIVNGTEGIDVREYSAKYLGDEFAKLAVSGYKLGTSIAAIAKPWIIKARVKAHINSFLSSHMIGIINSDSVSMYINEAGKSGKELKKVAKIREDYYNLTVKRDFEVSEDAKKILDVQLDKKVKELDASDIQDTVYFMKGGGLQTIRNSDESLNKQTAKFAQLFTHTKGKPSVAEEDISSTLDTLSLSSHTQYGKALNDLIDSTEVYPKLMFFKSQVKVHMLRGKSAEEARQIAMSQVLTAFPTYNVGGQLTEIAAEFLPFTTYYTNIPKMAGYAFSNNTGKAAAMTALLHGASYGSWAMQNGQVPSMDKWKKAYIPIPGTNYGASIHTEGFSPFTFDISGYFDSIFLLGGAKSMLTNPGSTIFGVGHIVEDE